MTNIRVQQCNDSENYAEAPVLPIVYPTVDEAYFASGQITKAASGTGHEINFTKISEAKVGDEIYIIIAHTQLKGEPLEIQVLQGKQEVLVLKDQPLKIQHQGKEVTKISIKGNHLDPDPNGNPFTNAANYCDQTIVRVTLGPKASKDFSTWNDKIVGCNGVAELYLKVDAHTANSVFPACFQYNGLTGFGAKADVTNWFLNQAGSWFGLKIRTTCLGFSIVNGLLKGSNVICKHSNSKVKSYGQLGKVKAIVLHRTVGSSTAGAIAHSKGTHFYIDRSTGRDGEIYQPINLKLRSSHIYPATSSRRISRTDIDNTNSIGIEVVGMHYSVKPNNKKVTKKYVDSGGDHYWDLFTKKQLESLVCLVKHLLSEYQLTKQDILTHEGIQKKTAGEGQGVLDALLPEL